ncbi:MAG: (d)CMP kinase [Opitutales bacterium]|nr:(d)CMP kinase [Opitutales bacterium]
MSNSFQILAIDGGAGTGKSTTASILADRLHLLHVDTGSHYRSITKYLTENEISPDSVQRFLAESSPSLSSQIEGNRSLLSVDGHIYPPASLRTKEVNHFVSHVASVAEVRTLLFDYQRGQIETAKENSFSGLVMEGRDIGTVILPDADLKIFLVADQKIRESRRQSDGEVDKISSRDFLDTSRSIAPLKESEGSLRIDTSQFSIEDVYAAIANKIGMG